MRQAKRPGAMIYFDLRPAMKRLSAEQKGHLFDAIMAYSEDGEEPEFADIALEIVWDFVKPRLDDDAGRYEETCAKRKQAANTRWKTSEADASASNDMQMHANASESMQTMPTTTTTSTTTTTTTSTTTESKGAKAPKAPARKKFSPPTEDEVAAYIREQGYTIDAAHFVRTYQAKGWLIGNTPMQDWKAKVDAWNAEDKNRASPSQPKATKVVRDQQYEQRTYANSPDIPEWMMQRWRESQAGGTS